MVSFVIPAHNEEACLARTVRAIQDSARELGEEFEVIVANDASTDRTGSIAGELGARVVDVNHRQIASTRNSGAREAHGEFIFFVDADTTVNARAVAEALRHLRNGAVGGGGPVAFEGPIPLYGRLLALGLRAGSKLAGFTGGAFMFCTHKAFKETGGFDEKMYFSEEGAFALALKRLGNFAVLWTPVLTSGRRLRRMSAAQLIRGGLRMMVSPGKTISQRGPEVEKIWYDSNRANDDVMPTHLGARLSNGILLVFVVILLTGPIWNFIPMSLTPPGTMAGNLRFVIRIFLTHAGTLILAPITLILFRNLFQQRLGMQWVKTAALFAVCALQAGICARGVLRIWGVISERVL